MTDKRTAPWSLIRMLEEGERLADALEAMRNETRADVSFQDEFAPSSSPATDETNSGVLQTKGGRLHCYNDHVIDYMEGALNRASELGLPSIPWFFPLQYPKVNHATYVSIAQMVAALCEGMEEQSDDWLAVKCYLSWLEACHALTDGASALFVAERMFVAGATAREFELSVRNRKHSTLGRKQNRHLSELRQSKNRRAKNDVEARRKIIAVLLKETRLSGGALDAWLVKQLAAQHGISVKARTVRADRKAIQG